MATFNAVRRVLWGVLVFCSVLACVLGFLLGRMSRPVSPPTGNPTLESIKQVAKLATIEYRLSDIVTKEKSAPWYLPLSSGKRVLVIARGLVSAGFDLKQPIRFESTSDGSNQVIRVTLPRAKILYVEATPDVYIAEGSPSAADLNQVNQDAKIRIIDAAHTAGICGNAEIAGSRFITSHVRDLCPAAKVIVDFD